MTASEYPVRDARGHQVVMRNGVEGHCVMCQTCVVCTSSQIIMVEIGGAAYCMRHARWDAEKHRWVPIYPAVKP